MVATKQCWTLDAQSIGSPIYSGNPCYIPHPCLNKTSFSKPPTGKSRNAQHHSFSKHLVSGPHSSAEGVSSIFFWKDEATQKQPDRSALDKQYPFSMNILGRLSLRRHPFLFTDMLLLHAPAILRDCIFRSGDSCFLVTPASQPAEFKRVSVFSPHLFGFCRAL